MEEKVENLDPQALVAGVSYVTNNPERWHAMILPCVIVALMSFAIGYEVSPGPERGDRSRNEVAKSQAEADKAQILANLAVQEAYRKVQLAVIKDCSDKGRIPVIVYGNVNCLAN